MNYNKKWQKKQLSNFIKINPIEKVKKGSILKKVSMADIQPYHRKIENYIISKYSGGSKFRNGDTLMARITPCLENGKTVFVDILDKKEIAYGSTEFIVLRNIQDESINKYVYYFTISPKFKNIAIKSMTGTSGRQRVQTDILKNLVFFIPNVEEQEKIISILSSLDDKIEMNNQINKNLEQIAQAIFKHWFIDFEFPNENGEPYKSSSSEMVDSEMGPIPKGWKIVRLDKLIKRNKQKIKNTKDWENKKLIDLSIMPRFSFCVNNFEKGSKLKTNIYKLNKFDILFGSIRPYFGKAGFSPINGVVTGTIFSYLPVKENLYSYILCLTTNKSFIDFTVKYSRGTKMPIIHWDDFVSYKVVVPEDDKLLESFNNMIMPLLKEIKVNINLNQDLSDMRDILLPKLMSGEIRVPINDK